MAGIDFTDRVALCQFEHHSSVTRIASSYPPKSRSKPLKLQVILEPSEEGGFTVFVPALPGCISQGDSREEALDNIREAIELYLEPVEDDVWEKTDSELVEISL
ncbi:MAG: type II toxin-antitoxin system HicB family antitoxin [Desulfococcaceae bacterium]